MEIKNDTVEKLESCPYCGGECSLGQDNGDHLGNREYWIDCDEQGCYYRSGNAQSASEAIATHNHMARAKEMFRYFVEVVNRCKEVRHDLGREISEMNGYLLRLDAKEFMEKLDYILRGDGDVV